jgi:hypothetical protein
MSKKIIWIPLLLITAILISGCTTTGTDLIPKTNLPPGFTYMGTHVIPVYIGGSSINATEGVYRNNGEDFYIQVIESDNPQALLAAYKLQIQKEFKSGSPFSPISFNGHDATKVTDIHTEKGQQKQDYSVVWATGKAMILVASPTADNQTVIALATATRS